MAKNPAFNIVAEVMSKAKGGGMGITYSLDPSAVILVAQFTKIAADIRSFKVPLTRCVKWMGPSLTRNFDVSGRPVKWAPLADITIERKAKVGAHRPSAPLIRFGLLRKTVGQQKIWKIDGRDGYAAIESLEPADYGIFHQEGFEGEEIGKIVSGSGVNAVIELAQSNNLPARPFMVFQEEDLKAFDRIFIEWIQERLNANGFANSRLQARTETDPGTAALFNRFGGSVEAEILQREEALNQYELNKFEHTLFPTYTQSAQWQANLPGERLAFGSVAKPNVFEAEANVRAIAQAKNEATFKRQAFQREADKITEKSLQRDRNRAQRQRGIEAAKNLSYITKFNEAKARHSEIGRITDEAIKRKGLRGW
jgi:phage gpG-like protein